MYSNFYSNQKDIINWLTQVGVRGYNLVEDSDYGFVVNTKESVVLKNYEFPYLKAK